MTTVYVRAFRVGTVYPGRLNRAGVPLLETERSSSNRVIVIDCYSSMEKTVIAPFLVGDGLIGN